MDLTQDSSQLFEKENILPSSLELREIKQKLLSGEKDQILESIEKIKLFLKNEKSITELIKSDITEFLCDAIIPYDDFLVEILYNCLEFFINHEDFFHYGHSCFTIESLIRSIYFLLKNSPCETILSQTLNLLIVIIQGFKHFNVFPEKKTIGNLLKVVPILLKTSSTTDYLKYQLGDLILNLLNLDLLKSSQEFHDTIAKCIFSWFEITLQVGLLYLLKEKMIMVSCAISQFYLRFLNSFEDLPERTSIKIDCELKHDIVRFISNFLINVGAPYFKNGPSKNCKFLKNKNLSTSYIIININSKKSNKKIKSLPVGVIESQFHNSETFFQSLIYLYNNKIPSQKSWITHGLSEMGFFQLMTRIISFVDNNSCQNLQKLCILLLSCMIFHLSVDVFQQVEFWPKGQDYLYDEIQKGFSKLPLDASIWLDILNNPNSPESCKVTLLLYLYFYCMTAKSEDILENIYPSIITYINGSNEILSSLLIIKLVWFIFVMSQLSYDQSLFKKSELQAYNKLVSTLEAQQDFSLVYTHHPGLLYWAFSSKVSKTIQLKIVQLWLINKAPDCKVIEDLIETSCDIRFAILDVMQYADGQILESAFSSLKCILTKGKDNDLVSTIWHLLSQILPKYTTNCISAPVVDYLIELCSLKIPNYLESTKIIRIASLLPEIFLKSDSIAVVPFLTLIFRVLELSLLINDFRVMSIFVHCNGFLEKVLERINKNTYESDIYSLKIIIVLWRNSKNIEKIKNREKIQLNKEIIIKVLENSNLEILSSGLDFLQEILLTNFTSDIFEINEVNVDFIEMLFFHTQSVCIKNFPSLCHRCWRCLKLFLMINYKNLKSVSINFLVDPLLNEVINFHLSNLNECREMMDFLIIWLHQHNEKLNDDCFKRKLFGGLFIKTVHKIASSLTKTSNNYSEDEQMLRKEVLSSITQCLLWLD